MCVRRICNAPAKQDEAASEQRIVSPHGRPFDERLGGRLLRDLADKLVEIRRHVFLVVPRIIS